MGNQIIGCSVEPVQSPRRAREYDEIKVPSRLAEHYTYFGWVRAKNRLEEEADRRVAGYTLSKKDDGYKVETIRRKKRFALNAQLVSLEHQYISNLNAIEKGKYRNSGILGFFAGIFLVICLLFVVIGIPQAPTTVLEANELDGIKKIIVDLTDDINEMLFYGTGYYVKDTDVNKDATDAGETVITLDGEFTTAYSFDDDQLMSTDIEALKEKLAEQIREKENLAEDELVDLSTVEIIKCEKAYEKEYAETDEEKEASAYYRYYIYYDNGTAPLGFLSNLLSSLNLPVNISPAIIIGVIFGIISIIFIICSVSVRNKRKKLSYQETIKNRAKTIVDDMRHQYPSLMSKSQRHYYSWQKVLSGAINASSAAKNDNSFGDLDGFDDDYSF